MRKLGSYAIIFSMFMFTILPYPIYAQDYESNEGYWLNKCSTAQTSQKDKQDCLAFRQYYEEKRTQLQHELSSITNNVDKLKQDISSIAQVMKQTKEQLTYINKLIEDNDANIRVISQQVTQLDETIKKKQADIKKRDQLIKSRMKSEQPSLGSHADLDILMGSNDLLDMMRRVEGIRKITESDQSEIERIQIEKKKLNFDKSEKKRLKEEAENKRSENVKNKEVVESLQSQQQIAIDLYQQQQSALEEQARSINVSISSLGNNIIKISDPDSVDWGNAGNNSGFVRPIQGTYISAGTWFYPSGGVHLGMDFAANIRTNVYAPTNGVILYANNPVSTTSGYYGNLGPGSGYPAGGGNSIHLLTQVNGTTYAISFYHLALEGFLVRAGQQVSQGQLIALSGNSGNTDGPHLHMELVNLGAMSMASAISRFQSTADFAWGTGWNAQGYQNRCEVKGPPCRQRVESVL